MRCSRWWPLALVSVLAGCAGPSTSAQHDDGQLTAAHEVAAPQTQAGGSSAVVAPLRGKPVRPDVLVTVPRAMSAREVSRVAGVAPGSVAFTVGTVRVAGSGVRVASVDAAAFRRYAAAETAESNPVWQVVAGGGVIASHVLAHRLALPLGNDIAVTGTHGEHLSLRLGAFATTGIPGTDLVVSTATGKRMGLHGPTSVILSASGGDPVRLAAKVRKVVGPSTQV
ncbi:MAG: hydrolase, partial [Frankiales bacterium]|nr:hydrolase [Frankiales bacterium]